MKARPRFANPRIVTKHVIRVEKKTHRVYQAEREHQISLDRHLNTLLQQSPAFKKDFTQAVKMLQMNGVQYDQLNARDKLVLIANARSMTKHLMAQQMTQQQTRGQQMPVYNQLASLDVTRQINIDLQNPDSFASQLMNAQAGAIQDGIRTEAEEHAAIDLEQNEELAVENEQHAENEQAQEKESENLHHDAKPQHHAEKHDISHHHKYAASPKPQPSNSSTVEDMLNTKEGIVSAAKHMGHGLHKASSILHKLEEGAKADSMAHGMRAAASAA